MKAVFWGTRGSIPSPLRGDKVRDKIRNAIESALAANLKREDDIDAFIDESLSFDESQTFGGNTSCVELRGNENRLILDMGSGIRELGANLISKGVDNLPKRLDILLSHLHWDHIQGFPFFAPAYIGGVEVHIWSGHSATEAVMRKQHSTPTFPVDFDTLGANICFHTLPPGETVEIAGFSVVSRKQLHHGDSYGYRVTQGGKSVVYATDIEHKAHRTDEMDACAIFFRDADLVIFDAMFAWGETQSVRQDWGHSSNVVGVDLCLLANARRLCLFHHDPTNSDAELCSGLAQTIRYKALANDAQDLEVISAHDGLVVQV